MAYINGHKVLSVVRTTYLSDTEHDLIARYNLGEYDSVSESGGITTITRQTGYADLSKLNWVRDTTYNYWYAVLNIDFEKPTDYNTKANLVCSTYNVMSWNNAIGSGNGIGASPSGYIAVDNGSSTITPSGFIQVKLATSYTEQVIANQPLNTLDQNGSQWLRNEWEKGLNLFDEQWEVGSIDTSTGALAINNNYYRSKNYITIKPNTTYYFNCIGYDDNIFTFFYDASYGYISYNSFYGRGVLSIPTNARFMKFVNVSRNTYQNNIMLVEGDHAYPYQAYNGAIVRESEIHLSFTTDNNPPTTNATWELLGTFLVSTYTIYVWRKA